MTSAPLTWSANRVHALAGLRMVDASMPRVITGNLNAPVLMPGVGAQGATMDDAQAIAGEVGHLVFPSVSRSVLAAGPEVAELRKRVSDLGKQAKG